MPTFRTAQRTVLTAAVLSTSVLAGPSLAHAAPVPPACMEALTTTFDKFPVLHYTVPTEVKNALLSGAAGLSEADQ